MTEEFDEDVVFEVCIAGWLVIETWNRCFVIL